MHAILVNPCCSTGNAAVLTLAHKAAVAIDTHIVFCSALH